MGTSDQIAMRVLINCYQIHPAVKIFIYVYIKITVFCPSMTVFEHENSNTIKQFQSDPY